MNISDTIRKRRKELGMTQEQMANQLGISAPAVNKWEKGISYPDITILAPLARLLKIDINELMSFHEELAEQEIGAYINQLSEDCMTEEFDKSFQNTVDYIRQYPNCYKLILWSAQVLNGYLLMKFKDLKDADRYEEQINKWFEKVAFCEDAELAKAAQMSLAQGYMRDRKYEEAQMLLDKIPPLGFDKRIVQIQLYSEQENYDDAFREQESMMYQRANGLVSDVLQLINMLCKKKQYESALEYADLISRVCTLFDLGNYTGASALFAIYVEMRDKESGISVLEKMMDNYDTLRNPRNSKLYEHMKFSENDGLDRMKEMILKGFNSDPDLDFIREDERYKKLYAKLVE